MTGSLSSSEMTVLAVDTATSTCSVAVMRGCRLVSELTLTRKETHSRHVMAMIDQAFDMAGISPDQVDGYAYTRGPGSFTGLRIGMSMVKALAFAAGKPLVGISTLETLAFQVGDTCRLICPMLDARNQEVYCARYQLEDGRLRLVGEEAACSPHEALDGVDAPCVLVGDGAQRYASLFQRLKTADNIRFADSGMGIIRAGSLGRLAWERYISGCVDDVRTAVPRYLRKSYAEQKPLSRGKAEPGFVDIRSSNC